MKSDNYPTAASAWLDYFVGNQNRGDALPWEHTIELDEPLQSALVRTLQRFHLGESGEGQWLKQWAAEQGDDAYCQTIALFVAEEQTHSRWFGLLLDNIGAPALKSHWSDAIFTKVRRAGGLHFELVTFLTAEIAGKRLFAGIARNCTDPLVRAVFGRIVKDESAHIAFHIATLRAAFAGQSWPSRVLCRAGWRLLLAAALIIVCLDQAVLFKALGLSRREFWAQSFRLLAEVSGKIWQKKARVSEVVGALQWD